METLMASELLQDLPRQIAARERYYRLESRIYGIYEEDRLKGLLDRLRRLCKRLRLHHVHRSHLEKAINAQFTAIERRQGDHARRIFGENLRPDIKNVAKTESRLLELIELRAAGGISVLIDNCHSPYSYTWPYSQIFPRQHKDTLHAPRKLHNLIKTKIQERTK